jgi:hypothetical protein
MLISLLLFDPAPEMNKPMCGQIVQGRKIGNLNFRESKFMNDYVTQFSKRQLTSD